jgi:cytochrome P450
MKTHMSAADTQLPPGPRVPGWVQGLAHLAAPNQFFDVLGKRYGSEFTIRLPLYGGPAVVISDPVLVKQLFQTPTDIVRQPEPNLSSVLGWGSTFGLHSAAHRRRRKLLVPSFHGKRMRAYEGIVEEETLKEIATWPEGREFAVMPSTMRITLNVILHTVFGAEGKEFETLRELMPPMVTYASRLMVVPWLHRDLGPHSPWGRFTAMRKRFDRVVDTLIARAESDANAEARHDVLSMMLQARYDDGTAMAHDDIRDELFTLLAAGHETTATQLAWTVERLRRHPRVLSRLVEEVKGNQSEYLQATIYESQRVRPVINGAGRRVVGNSLTLGPYVIPQGYTILVAATLMHANDEIFADANTFDPDRFMGGVPDSYSWVPFGGGSRRCLGAPFANMEMNVVLRTVLREVRIVPTGARDERWHNRGVAYAPRNGGLAVIHRRTHRPVTDSSTIEPSGTVEATDSHTQTPTTPVGLPSP